MNRASEDGQREGHGHGDQGHLERAQEHGGDADPVELGLPLGLGEEAGSRSGGSVGMDLVPEEEADRDRSWPARTGPRRWPLPWNRRSDGGVGHRVSGGAADRPVRPRGGRGASTRSSEPPVDVVGGPLVGRVVEDLRRRPLSTIPPGLPCSARKNAALLGDTGGLLHVVGDDDDGHLGCASRRWSPRSGGSRSGRGPSTARPSRAPWARRPAPGRCTAAAAGRRRAPTRAGQPVLHLVPEPGPGQAPSTSSSSRGLPCLTGQASARR